MKKFLFLLLPGIVLATTDDTLTLSFQNDRISADMGNKEIGFVEFHTLPNTNPKIVHATRLFVDPTFRDLGIGSDLFHEFLEKFEAEPKTQIILHAYPFGENPSLNEQALIKFYKGFGFEFWHNSPYPYISMRKKNPDITTTISELPFGKAQITASVNNQSVGSVTVQKPTTSALINLYRRFFLKQPVTGNIGFILIDPKFRNKGVAGTLMPAALNHLEQQCCTEVTAHTSSVPNAIKFSPRFYQHFGFKPLSVDQYPIMRKDLRLCLGKSIKNTIMTRPYLSGAMGALITGSALHYKPMHKEIQQKIEPRSWY